MYKILITVILASFTLVISGQSRVERPIQIHLNGSGVFLKTLGNTLADSEIDELTVNNWVFPGISIGYHVNKRFYIGYSFEPNRNLILHEPWSFGGNEADGNIILDHNTGQMHLLEGRYFPFRFGLYGALSLIHLPAANYDMEFNRINSEMILGQNSYETDLLAQWNFRSMSTIGFGVGYNFVHKSGISFDVGLAVPIPFNDILYENIVLTSVQDLSIDAEDLTLAANKIEGELFYFPTHFRLSLGYNFRFKM